MSALLVALAVVFGGDTLKTEIIFLGDLPAANAITLWERVIGPAAGATIIEGRAPDVVVVKDSPDRLRRFRGLLQAIAGHDAKEHIYVRPVTFMMPTQLTQLATQIMGDRASDATFIPDDRSGQLVIRATPANYKKVDVLLRKLDRPPPGTLGNRKVIGVEPEPDGGLP